MYWNYRVIKLAPKGTPYDQDEYVICEMHYDEDGGIEGWCLGASGQGEAPFGETPEELHQSLEWMLAAFDKLTLDESELLAESETRKQVTETSDSTDVQVWIDSPEFEDRLLREDEERDNEGSI